MAPWQSSDSSLLPLRLGASEQPPPSSNAASNQPQAASSQPPDRDGFNVWRAKVRSLTPQQRKQFLAHKHDDLASYLADLENIAKNQGSRRAQRIATVMKRLWELSKVLAPVSSDSWLSEGNMWHPSLVLGGVTYLLSFSGRFLDYYDRVLELLADMLERLPIVEKIELLHAARPDPDLRDAAVNICSDVLEFCIEASDMFVDRNGRERVGASLLLVSMRSSFQDRFGKLKSEFAKHVRIFDTYAQLAMARRQVEFMRERETRDMLEDERTLRRAEREHQLDSAELIRLQEAKRHTILERIPSLSLQGVQDDRLERCLGGTGQWLLNHATFQSWISSPRSKLLWVHGKHGCGKSHLAALTVDHLARTQLRDAGPALSYIYCNLTDASRAVRDLGSSDEQSASLDLDRLIGTILKQLLRYLPVSESLPSLEGIHSLSGDGRPTREQMKTAIIDALAKIRNAFIVIDGLDECHKLGQPSFAKLCSFISSLSASRHAATGPKIKVIVFSRPNYSEIEIALAGALTIQVDGGANSADIELFVNDKMSGLTISERVLQEISTKLVSRADGMFLWVDLVYGTLKNERSVRGIRKAIENLPEGLHTVYEWSMERIFRQSRVVRDRAFSVLLWATNARRPLSREELMEALAVERGMTELDEEARLVNDDGFVAECADLIVLRNGYYQLLHVSLKEYLELTPTLESASPALKSYAQLQKAAQKTLAETCIFYLNFTTCRRGPFDTLEAYNRFLEDNPFFCYASLNWGYHMDQIRDRTLAGLAVRFLSSKAARETCLQHALKVADWPIAPSGAGRPFPFMSGSTVMHSLALYGQQWLAQANPCFWVSIYTEDGYGNLPFKYAVVNGSSDMCHFILDIDQKLRIRAPGCGSPIFCSRDALQCAAFQDWPSLVERLITCGLDKNTSTGTWDPPLHVAARNGSRLALSTLLAAGADPNIMSEDRETPLTLATAAKERNMVALLIEKGANVNVRSGPRDQTPLHIAASKGSVDIARLLLEHGCDVNAIDRTRFTPVNQAAHDGKLSMVKLLIHEYHANPTGRCCDGTDILHLAVLSGNCELVLHLLDLGCEPSISGRYGYTVLHAAAGSARVDMLKLLLENFPDLDLRATNKSGETPLHFAADVGSLEVVKYLLETDHSLATVSSALAGLPLHSAVRGNRLECAELLATPDNIDAEGPQGRTPLNEAARLGHLSLVELLLWMGADVNKPDGKARTPVLAAAANGHLRVVDHLIQHGADITKTDNENEGLLFSLLFRGHFSAAERLLDKGIPVDSMTLLGITPLLLAARLNCTRVTSRLLDQGADHTLRWKNGGQTAFLRAVNYQSAATVGLFEQRGVSDYCAVDNSGTSAIHLAARRDNFSMLRRFLRGHEALAFQTDFTGTDALCVAAHYGSDSTIPFLISIGFKPDGLGKHCTGLTPLSLAAWDGNATTTKLLITAGANVNRVGGAPWHRNAGHWAASNGHFRTTQVLIQAGVDLTARDSLGYSVADYVQQSEIAWRRNSSYESGDTHSSERWQGSSEDVQDLLRKTVLDCATALLALDGTLINDQGGQPSIAALLSQSARIEFLRRHHLACLAQALDRLYRMWPLDENRRDSAWVDACLCMQEVIRGPYTLPQGIFFNHCSTCEDDLDNAVFKCTSCQITFICPGCHSEYIQHGRAIPESYRALSRLEEEVSLLRVALEPLRGNIKLLTEAVCKQPQVENWVLGYRSVFEKWSKTYITYGARNPRAFSENRSRKFISVLARAVALWQGSAETGTLAEMQKLKAPSQSLVDAQDNMVEDDEWIVLGHELMDSYLFDGVPELYGELPIVEWCKGHEFVRIPAFSELAEEEKALFDSQKRLKGEFFKDVLQRYSQEWLGATNTGPDNSERRPCQDNALVASTQVLLITKSEGRRDDEDEARDLLNDLISPQEEDEPGKMDREGVEARVEQGEAISAVESVLVDQADEIERGFDNISPTEYPRLIGERLRNLFTSEDWRCEALRAREYIRLFAERVGPWPPLETTK